MWPTRLMGADSLVPKQLQPSGGEIGGWSDWSWLTGGCLSFTLPARGLILPQQPCCFPCSRPLTGSRKRPGLTVSCPGSAALRLMTPTALCWQLKSKNNTLFCCLGSVFLDSLIHSWDSCSCHFYGTLSRLSHFLPWTHPFPAQLLLRPDVWHHTGGRLCGYQGDVIWPSHASAQHSSTWRLREAALTNRPAPCLSAALWDSAVPLWQILLSTQKRWTLKSSELLICKFFPRRRRKQEGAQLSKDFPRAKTRG